MRLNDRPMIADFAAALSQIADQLFATIELGARGLIAIEISDQANSQRNVVQIITVNVSTVDLPAPAITDFDLPIAGRCAISDHKMVSKPVLHPAKVSMVIIESGCVSLPRAAVMHDDVLPSAARYRGTIDLIPDRRAQVTITGSTAASFATAEQPGPKSFRFFVTRFFNS